MVALLLSVVGANAKTVTTTTPLTINNDGVISSDQFSSVVVNDVITFSHETSGGTHFKLFYKIGANDGWAYHKFTGVTYNSSGDNDYYTPWINDGDTYTITITPDDLEKMKDYGIWLEDYAGITNVTLTHSGKTTIWTGSVSFDNWANKVTNIKSTSGAKIGDDIQVTFTDATTSDNAIWICKSNGEVEISKADNTKWGQTSVTNESGTVEFEITDAVTLEAVQSGIMLKGKNATVTEVSLLTYAESYDAVSITVGSDEIATYSNGNKNVQISACDALKAYYASAVAEGTVTLTELTGCIPASQGVIIKGAEGTYTVPVGGEGWPSITTNYLKPTGDYGANVAASIEGTYHYIFAKNNSNKIGFYKLAEDFTEGGNPYHVMSAHKAYLETTDDITPETSTSRVALVFDDGETTGIQELENSSIEELNHSGNEALKAYYNLNGQRVANPRKGLYVVNGKKVIIK